MPSSWLTRSFYIGGRWLAFSYELSEAYVGPCSAMPSPVTDHVGYTVSRKPRMHGDFTGSLVI